MWFKSKKMSHHISIGIIDHQFFFVGATTVDYVCEEILWIMDMDIEKICLFR